MSRLFPAQGSADPQEKAPCSQPLSPQTHWSHRRTFISVTCIYEPGAVLGAGCLVVKKTTSWAQLTFQQRKVSDPILSCQEVTRATRTAKKVKAEASVNSREGCLRRCEGRRASVRSPLGIPDSAHRMGAVTRGTQRTDASTEPSQCAEHAQCDQPDVCEV